MQRKKKSVRIWRGMTSLIASLLVLVLGGTSIAYAWSSKINEYLGTSNYVTVSNSEENEDVYYYKSDFNTTSELIEARNDVMERIQAEGTVLLKNNASALPLAGKKVTLFGMTSYDPIYGGKVGSSSPMGQPAVGFKEAFESAGLEVNPTMIDFYKGKSKTYTRMSLAPTWAGFAGMERKDLTIRLGEVPTDEYTKEVKESYSSYGDAAVVVIGRQGTEADDFGEGTNYVQDGDGKNYTLGLQDIERDLIAEAKSCSDTVVVLVNTANPMEIEELKKDQDIDAIMWIGEPGEVGLNSVADILAGKTNPSGHLPDTYAVSSVSSPAMVNFGSYTFSNAATEEFGGETYSANNYLVEAEGIYIGYKYYETRYEDSVLGLGSANSTVGSSSKEAWNYANEVSYSFGYGLSYTTFSQEITKFEEQDKQVTMEVKVTNTGSVAGKDVVQLYVQTPYTDYDKENNIEKSAVQLIGFEKTGELEPGASETVTVTVDKEMFASYDYTTAKTYIMDAGDYYFSLGNGAHDALNNILAQKGYTTDKGMDYEGNKDLVRSYNQKKLDTTTYAVSSQTGNAITNQFDEADLNHFMPGTVTYLSRNNWESTWPVEYKDIEATDEMQTLLIGDTYTLKKGEDTSETTFGAKTKYQLSMMIGTEYDNESWDMILDQIDLKEASTFIQLGGSGIEAIKSIVLPAGVDADGPNGILDAFGGKVLSTYWTEKEKDEPTYVGPDDENAKYQLGTFPTEPTVAATFSKTLASEMGYIFGEDSLWSNITTIYAPGLNIHRNPYNGRNHEYYSEDSMLTYYMGTALVKKASEKGAISAPKHLAFNDQETGRNGIAPFMNEQQARENELRGFQGSFTIGDAKGTMTAYNRIGCTWVSASKGLLTEVLRNEWGFQGWVNTDMASNELYHRWEEGVLAGTDLMLNTTETAYADLNAKNISGDATMMKAVHEAMHHTLAPYVNSNLMNGIAKDTELVYVTTWWQKALIGVDIGFGVLTVIILAGYVFAIRKSRKQED
jgi:beta-glucosidase